MEKQQIINQIIADIASKTQTKSISPADIANNLYNILEYASQQGLVTTGSGSPDTIITDQPFARWFYDNANRKLYVKISQEWQPIIDLNSITNNYGANIEKAVQRTIRDLEGAKNGDNIIYKTYGSFVLGTSAVYLNGQRLFAGKSYIEKDDTTIEFTSYIPLNIFLLLLLRGHPKQTFTFKTPFRSSPKASSISKHPVGLPRHRPHF